MLKRTRSFLVLVMLLMTVTMSAQVTTATMSGKVTAQDEPIIGATIVAIHEPSGTRYGTVTNVSGQFNLQGMRTGGPYKVEISYVGYQTAIYKGINLLLGENYVLNVSLKESSELLDEVVVTASKESNMKSDRAGAIMNANRDMISNTPTISRSISDIMRLSPQGADVGNGFAVGGGNYRQSFVTVDGAAFNNTFGLGGNLPANGSPISLDALEQVTVAVTPFDVRQSGFTGGAINAVTRSGDNQFRGTAYMYFNNENLKGSKVDDYELLRSKAQYYTYGASFGGPIIKDKLFFFVNGEYEDNVTAGSNYRPRTALGESYSGGNIHRPLQSDMDDMRGFLLNKYNFDPGKYNDYSTDTPAYRVMARVDWNANQNNKVSFRFTKTHTKDSNFPTSSVSPLSTSALYPGGTSTEVIDGKPVGTIAPGQGRTSKYALSFSNSNYYQVRDFTSVAGEWNSRMAQGAMNNMLRFAYSYQDEPRSFDGPLFPTVDILQDGAVYANFGADLFTAGNLRQTKVFTITDEFNWNVGINKFMAGFQYEHTKAINGYMLGGAGYYVYSSWSDFVNDETPKAFAITHSNSPDMSQFLAELKFQQYSLYLQDILNRLVHGSASSFNQQTNVDLTNKYTVLDISELTGSSDLLTVGMFVALDYVWDKAKENRTEEKAIFVDEVWQLIGASSNRLAAEFVLEIAKIIRAYSGAGIFATQDLNDFFALDDGKYGKGIINNCKTKIILNMEDEEAQRVKTILHLSETEVMNITHFQRGNGLISTNNNNITVEFKASNLEKELITTDRQELLEILAKQKKQAV